MEPKSEKSQEFIQVQESFEFSKLEGRNLTEYIGRLINSPPKGNVLDVGSSTKEKTTLGLFQKSLKSTSQKKST